jgi:hypothetical protein
MADVQPGHDFNPFTTLVQLHHTPQASMRPIFSTVTNNAGVDGELMSSGMHTEGNIFVPYAARVSSPRGRKT